MDPYTVPTPSGWTPKITADLEAISGRAFNDQLAKFRDWLDEHQDEIPPVEDLVREGWNEITPYMAQGLLGSFKRNRKVSLTAVRNYALRMKAGRWVMTGEALCADEREVKNGYHRLLGCLLSGASFVTYVVTSVPENDEAFLYYDNGKTRTTGEILEMGGENGLSGPIAQAIKLAWRYENDALSVLGQPQLRQLDNAEAYKYSKDHPIFRRAAHTMTVDFNKAMRVIVHKGIAVFTAAKILELFGSEALEHFMGPLGSGANLDEDSPILALRNRLLGAEESDDEIKVGHRLALVIKAFVLAQNDYVMPRTGRNRQHIAQLSISDVEPYPKFEDAVPQAEAA